MNKNTLFYAYTAGYIDGDGCFYIGKYTLKSGRIRYQARLVISSTNPAILNLFAKTYGGTAFLCDKRTEHIGQKPQYQFAITHSKSLNLIKNCRKYLVEKINQAITFYAFIEEDRKEVKENLISIMKKFKHDQDLIEKEQKELLVEQSLTIRPTEIDYAYFAGFIDAECCLSVSTYKPKGRNNDTFKIYLACNNSKLPIFQWIMRRFGGNIQFISRRS